MSFPGKPPAIPLVWHGIPEIIHSKGEEDGGGPKAAPCIVANLYQMLGRCSGAR
jgi:hypothetical protein